MENHDQMMERQSVTDPTQLTTQSILREVTSLKEVLFTRIEAMDKATALFQTNLTQIPTETQKAVATLQHLHEAKLDEEKTARLALSSLVDEKFLEVFLVRQGLEALMLEKFEGVKQALDLRDKGVKETADLTSTALQAALAASEKSSQKTNDSFVVSAAKTEASFTKTQDAQAAAVSALSSALNDKLQDQKERITAIESRSGGMGAMWGFVAGGIGLLLTIISVGMAVAIFVSRK